MHNIIERPLSDDERQFFGDTVRKPTGAFKGLEQRMAAHGAAVLILGSLILIMGIDLRWDFTSGAIFLTLAFALYVLLQTNVLVVAPLQAHRRRMEAFLKLQRLLATEKIAQVQRVVSSEVVQINHDDGSFYLFAIGPEKTFWTEAPADGNGWPNTDFELFKISGWPGELGPIIRGTKLKPRLTIDTRDFGEADFEIPEDGVIDESIDSFLERHGVNVRDAQR